MAESRIGGQSREPVGAAALHAEQQVRQRRLTPLDIVDHGQHRGDLAKAAVDHGLRTPHFLNAVAHDGLLQIHPALDQEFLDGGQICLLAAESNEEDAAHVRMRGVVCQRPKHDLDIRPVGTPAALVVRDRDDAVDVRKLGARVLRELGHHRDLLRLMARAHARRHDEDEVARPDAPVGPPEAAERPPRRLGKIVRSRKAQVGGEFTDDRHVVGHVLDGDRIACLDAARRANWLAVLAHQRAGRHVRGGEAVAGTDGASDRQLAAVRHPDPQSGRHAVLHDGHVVLRRVDHDRVVRKRSYRAGVSHKGLVWQAGVSGARRGRGLFDIGGVQAPAVAKRSKSANRVSDPGLDTRPGQSRNRASERCVVERRRHRDWRSAIGNQSARVCRQVAYRSCARCRPLQAWRRGC